MPITPATLTDIPELVALVNSAYRGEGSKAGWTTEADLIDGQRIDAQSLATQMSDPKAIILKNTNDEGKVTGCVYVHQRGDKAYLGLLTVSPALQANGLGRQLLAAAETYAKGQNIKAIVMTVITTRTELIQWYERRGYSKNGEVIPLLIPEQFGILKQPLEMFWLQKEL